MVLRLSCVVRNTVTLNPSPVNKTVFMLPRRAGESKNNEWSLRWKYFNLWHYEDPSSVIHRSPADRKGLGVTPHVLNSKQSRRCSQAISVPSWRSDLQRLRFISDPGTCNPTMSNTILLRESFFPQSPTAYLHIKSPETWVPSGYG